MAEEALSVKNIQNLPANLKEGIEVINLPKNAAQYVYCFEHIEEELKLFCETCGELICYKCALQGGKHQSHNYEDLNQAFEKYQEEITSSIEPMKKQVVIINKALALIKQRCGEISNQRAAIENNIHVTFRKLREVLTVRETDLIGQLHQMTHGKLKSLAIQSDKIETTLAKLNSCLHFMGESSKVGKSDRLKMKANTAHQMKEFTTPFQQDTLKPNAEANMVFSALADLTAACKNYGQIFSPGSPKCHTGLEVAVKSTQQLQHIRESRSSVAVKSPIEKLGTPIDRPLGVAINKRGKIVVTGYCVSMFSPGGENLRSFGTKGSDQGQFIWPCGVTVDGNGNILVTDTLNRIQKFTADGKFLTAVGRKGSRPLYFDDPTDIAFNTINNKVYVADSGNHSIQVLNSDLTFSSRFGWQGNGKRQFNYPWGIACDSTGKVYVADNENYRIQVFSAEGKFIRMFRRHGGELFIPQYVAVDTRGMVYVSEEDNRVSVFTTEGQFVTSFGKKGDRPGEFYQPHGLAVDNNGVVYVCDYMNSRIQAFNSF